MLGTLWRPLLVRPLPASVSLASADIVALEPVSVLRFLVGGSSAELSLRRDLEGLFAAAASLRSRAGRTLGVIRRCDGSTGVSSSRGVGMKRALWPGVRAGHG